MFAFIYIEERLGERNILLFMTKLVCHEGVCIMRVCELIHAVMHPSNRNPFSENFLLFKVFFLLN